MKTAHWVELFHVDRLTDGQTRRRYGD